MKKIVVALLLTSTVVGLGGGLVAEAQDVNSVVNTTTITSEVDERLQTSPASYEYKTTGNISVSPSNAMQIRNDVNAAKTQNKVANFVKLSGTMMKLAGYKVSGSATNTIGKMIKSDMKIKTTEAFAKKVIDSKKSKTAKFKIKRFFDGNRMHDWYYYDIIG